MSFLSVFFFFKYKFQNQDFFTFQYHKNTAQVLLMHTINHFIIFDFIANFRQLQSDCIPRDLTYSLSKLIFLCIFLIVLDDDYYRAIVHEKTENSR